MPDQIAQTRLAATILLLRDDPDLQVFMAKRHYQIDFAAGALVFPGGKAADDDARAEWAGHIDGDPGDLTAAAIAAVRETFEECGLLLCRHRAARGAGAKLAGPEVVAELAPFRETVDRGEQSFRDLIVANDLVLALDRLTHFAHWITPEFMPKRFDTHFFVARAPAGQIAVHDGRETTASEWIAPAEALRRSAAGEAAILFPTRLNLELLTGAVAAEDAVIQARARPVSTVMPVIRKSPDGEDCLTIPDDAGYGVVSEPVARARRLSGQ